MSNLVKYNKLSTDFTGLVNELHNMFWRDPIFQLERNWRPESVNETEDSYTIEVELPRVKRDQINVEVQGRSLAVTVKTPTLNYHRKFAVSDADPEQAKVRLEDGVLSVVIPKNQPERKLLKIE